MTPNIENLRPFLPQETGLRAHAFRVAALASRAAESQGSAPAQIEAIYGSALLHHQTDFSEPSAMAKLMRDLGFEMLPHVVPVPESVADIVRAFQGVDGASSPAATDAAAFVESANLFDEQMENQPYEDCDTATTVAELLESGMVSPEFCNALRAFRMTSADKLLQNVKQLPVFPKAALQALRLAADPEAGTREVENAICKDPVLAGEVVQLANSGMMTGSGQPVHSVGAALARVGMTAATHLISTAALRRCFASGSLQRLWSHSLETAEGAQALAREYGKAEPGEAFLAGLVHDVGRMAYELSDAAADVRAWEEAGFPTTYAEYLVSGTDHAAVGAAILKSWNFPEAAIEAIRNHHRPESTPQPLAAMLYAVEEFSESLPSCARDHIAAKRLDISEIRKVKAAG